MLPIFATNRIDLYLFQLSSVIWFVPELISTVTQNRARNAETHDGASGFVLMISIFVGIFLGLQTAFSARQFAISGYRPLLFGAGVFLILTGVALRWYAIWVLGKYFTRVVSIQTGQTVVEKGPYRFIRHPSYSGAMLSFLGFGLALSNWLSLGLVVLGTAIGYSYRVQVEEQALINGLGQPYRDYMQHTKRFIPFVF
jgi:protein-S-isoprenylcysteine O-methyltransferase Ste14